MKPRTPPAFFSAQIAEARRFHLDLSPPARTPLAVVCGGCEHCATDYAIHRRGFAYYSIEYVTQGKGKLRLAGRDYELYAGTLYAYGPGIAHDITSDARDRLVKYFVDFTGREARPLLAELSIPPGGIRQTKAPNEIMEIFDDLIRDGLRETPFTARQAAAHLQSLLLKIAETAIPYGAGASAAFATYQRCKRVIETRWRELRSLEEISSQCHVAAAHLCRLFRRFDHQSPYQHLLRLKMQHAAQRLQSGSPTIKEVADEFGYCDPFHFSRVFKAVLGMTPSHFARRTGRA